MPRGDGRAVAATPVYTEAVRPATKFIGLTACLSLLSLQFSGLHMHADAAGFVGGLEPVHVHGLGRHEQLDHDPIAHDHNRHATAQSSERDREHHAVDAAGRLNTSDHSHTHDGAPAQSSGVPTTGEDYAGARDVPLLAPAIDVSAGLSALTPAAGFALIDEPRLVTFLGTDFAYPVLSGRYTRWRPPLRAPPRNA